MRWLETSQIQRTGNGEISKSGEGQEGWCAVVQGITKSQTQLGDIRLLFLVFPEVGLFSCEVLSCHCIYWYFGWFCFYCHLCPRKL